MLLAHRLSVNKEECSNTEYLCHFIFFDHEYSENKKLIIGNASIVAKGFGATDCQAGCGAHLLYLGI